MERSERLKKIFHNGAKNHLPDLILRNLIRKGCFQMNLNARQSPEDSLSEIKADANLAKF